jgi:hypothetical protein
MTSAARALKPGALEFEGREILLALAKLTEIAIKNRQDIAELRARLPPPRFEFPPGWISAKAARDLSGYSLPQMYAWARSGKIVSAKDGGHIRIDPASLPRRARVKTQSA